MQIKKIILFFVISVLALILLVSCSENEYPIDIPPVAVSIVLGRHANANAFPEDYYVNAKTVIEKAVYDGSYISVIVNDGNPYKIDNIYDSINDSRNGTEVDFTRKANTRSRQIQYIEARTEAIIDYLKDTSVRAISNENNLLNAVIQAKDSMNTVEHKMQKKNILSLLIIAYQQQVIFVCKIFNWIQETQ